MSLSSRLAPSSIAKPGVCTSTTRPASPYEGQFIYETDTDKVYAWNGAMWVEQFNSTVVDAKGDIVVGTSDNVVSRQAVGSNGQYLAANSATSTGLEWQTRTDGLVFVASLGFNGTSSTSFNNIFSSTYGSYRIVISGFQSSSTTQPVLMRFRTASDDSTSNYFWSELFFFSTTFGTGGNAAQNTVQIGAISYHPNSGGSVSMDVHLPNAATATSYMGHSVAYQDNTGVFVTRNIAGGTTTSTQYTGLTIYSSGGALLFGTLRVYGYRN